MGILILILLLLLLALLWRVLKRPAIAHPGVRQVLKTLYASINTHRISKEAREQEGLKDAMFTYGEIDFQTLDDILKIIHPKPHQIFYDLGSGSGHAVLAAALLYPLRKAIGIEYLKALHELACDRLTHYQGTTPVQFIHGDIFTEDWHDADIVFINATCFFGTDWDKLTEKCRALKPGSFLIITSKKLPEADFKLLNREPRYMSWGYATVSIYQRRASGI